MHCRDRATPGTSFVEICLTIRRTIRKGQGSPTSSRIVQQISSYRCTFHEFLRIDSPDQLFGSDPEGSKVQKPSSAIGNTGKDADEVPFTEGLARIVPRITRDYEIFGANDELVELHSKCNTEIPPKAQRTSESWLPLKSCRGHAPLCECQLSHR